MNEWISWDVYIALSQGVWCSHFSLVLNGVWKTGSLQKKEEIFASYSNQNKLKSELKH